MSKQQVAIYNGEGDFVRFMEYGGLPDLAEKAKPTAKDPMNTKGSIRTVLGGEVDEAASQFGDNFDSHVENVGLVQQRVNELNDELSTAGAVHAQRFRLGKRSKRELEGVHPDLLAFATELITRTDYDWGVFDGVRTPREQAKLVARGVSKTSNSYHLYGLAVDLVPYINGKYVWEGADAQACFADIRKHALDIISEQGYDIHNGFLEWGWDEPHWQLTGLRDIYDVRLGGFIDTDIAYA